MICINGNAIGSTYNVNYTIIFSRSTCDLNDSIVAFSSNVFLTGFTGTLTFQILKFCSDSSPTPIGPPWSLSRSVLTTEASTFTFFICDCDSCCDDSCYTYRALVTFTPGDDD